jgi:cytochrome c biogenesis protein CcmG/thiol:disulfide interchange protein DsbE
MRPSSRQTTIVGPTQGGDGFGLGRGGGWYRRRLERDFGIRKVPFPGRRPSGRGRAATTNDRTAAGRLAATVALVACLCLAGCAGGGSGGATGGTAAPGQALGSQPLVARNEPQFQADLDGLRGRVVVVNFWASWCVPCRQEMPALEQASRAWAEAGKPVTVIGVDASDVRGEAAKFLTRVGVTYPTVYDQQGLRGGVAASWSVTALPQTWFVARDGSRAGRIAGRLQADDLRSRVDELLGGS